MLATRMRQAAAAASTFLPTDIASLEAWYDLNDTSTLWQNTNETTPATSNNDPVGSVSDLSGNGYTLANTGATTRPLLKTAVQNSKNALLFDGSNDYLTDTFTLNQPATVFIVAKRVTHVAFSRWFGGALGASRMDFYFGGAEGSNHTLNAGSNGPTWSPNSNWHIFRALFNGASSQLSVDGAAATTGNVGSNTPGGFTLATPGSLGGPFANIYVGEAAVFSEALSSGDIDSMEAYLSDKWGITVS